MIDLWKKMHWQISYIFNLEYADMEDDDDILYHVPCVNEDVNNNLLFIHMTCAEITSSMLQ